MHGPSQRSTEIESFMEGAILMALDPTLKLFVQQVHLRADARHQAHRWKWLRRFHPGESILSVIPGATCLLMAAAVSVVTIMSTLDVPARPWTIPYEVLKEDPSRGRDPRLDPESSRIQTGPVMAVERVTQSPGIPCRVL